MPIPRITAAQFEANLQADIIKRDSRPDVTTGPIRDQCIRPSAKVFEGQNERIRQLFQLLAFQSVDDLPAADVDAFAFNEEIVRSQGTPAFVPMTFSRAAKPTVDLPVPSNFPIGTDTDSVTGVQTTFVTLQPAILVAANADAYYNGQTQRYELTVMAASITLGPGAKVGRNRVTKPLRPLPGFDSVSNKVETSGGLPAETNADVRDRFFLRILGTEIGTSAGLSRYTRQAFGNVQDILIVSGNNPFLTRASFDAGAVDCWILGSSPIERTMTVPYPGQLVVMPFDRQPGISVTSVTSGVTFTQNVDFIYYNDPGEQNRSTRGRDGIMFLPTGSQPAVGAPVTITYQYDSLIVALQAFFGTPEYQEDGRDALFRRGIEVPIAIQGTLKVNAGDPNQVLAQVQQALLDAINGSSTQRGYKLGQTVEEFDLDRVLSRIPGVDNFTYTLLAPVGSSGVGDIPMNPNEYPRLSVANLSVTLT